MHIANVLNLLPDEIVTTMLVVPDFGQVSYITLLTRLGRIKRVEANAFANIRSVGLIAMNLDEGDSLDFARMTHGEQEFLIITKNGKALRFREETVRSMGRTAAGVMAIRLLGDDEIVGVEVVDDKDEMLIIHQNGWGKRVPVVEYATKGRYTQGVLTTDMDFLPEIGPIVSARVVHPEDQITIITSNGIVLRTRVNDVSIRGRATRGVRVVNLGEGDSVAALAVLKQEDLDRGVDAGGDTEEDLVMNGGDNENGEAMAAPVEPAVAEVVVDPDQEE